MDSFVLAVALGFFFISFGLLTRWQIAAREPRASPRALLTRSRDPQVEKKRRHFFLSLIPLVIWSQVFRIVLG